MIARNKFLSKQLFLLIYKVRTNFIFYFNFFIQIFKNPYIIKESLRLIAFLSFFLLLLHSTLANHLSIFNIQRLIFNNYVIT